MGEGTDIAMESANITLMRGDLMLIPEVIKISKRSMKIIKQKSENFLKLCLTKKLFTHLIKQSLLRTTPEFIRFRAGIIS